jgi:L-2-hydroxyglutarate oxidase
MRHAEIVIVGGGIVGLATAYQLTERHPDCHVRLLEKESRLAEHQTGHNSGVLHTGIYYKPNSLKAINCRAGKRAMEQFCQEQNIPFELCGKVIVAVDESELDALQRIYERGQANGVRCEIIGPERLAELEPHARGVRAIHVPEAGIIDYRAVCDRLGDLLLERGATIWTNAKVTSIRTSSNRVHVETTRGEASGDFLINCAGLHSDRVTELSGSKSPAKIVPFRGEYYELVPEAFHLCRNLIYPVPNPNFPFLGVHFTRCINNTVECGPNAVLAFAREGYYKTSINPYDLFESLTYPGFLKLAAKYWRIGAGEMWRSISKRAFVKALQRLVPEIRREHLHAAPAGVRAQAVGRDGAMVDDFLIIDHDRIVNVANAPSPAATSSLNIGALIADKLESHLAS